MGTRRRSLDFERGFTELAAKGVANHEPIRIHAESRALRLSGEYVPDPMLVQTGRNRLRDVREELADARNHLCWLAEERQAAGDDDGAHAAAQALRHVILAYDVLRED